MKPYGKRRSGGLEPRSGHRVNVVTAATGVSGHLFQAVIGAEVTTLWAFNAFLRSASRTGAPSRHHRPGNGLETA